MKPGRVRETALFGFGAGLVSPVEVAVGVAVGVEEDVLSVVLEADVVRVVLDSVCVVVALVDSVEVVEAVVRVAVGVNTVAVPVVPLIENFGLKLKLLGSLSSMIWKL